MEGFDLHPGPVRLPRKRFLPRGPDLLRALLPSDGNGTHGGRQEPRDRQPRRLCTLHRRVPHCPRPPPPPPRPAGGPAPRPPAGGAAPLPRPPAGGGAADGTPTDGGVFSSKTATGSFFIRARYSGYIISGPPSVTSCGSLCVAAYSAAQGFSPGR